MSGGERGVVDFGKLFAETNEEKFSLGGVNVKLSVSGSVKDALEVVLFNS